MNRRTVLFLLEEPSAQDLLQRLLPRVLMTGGVGKKDPRPELPQGAENGSDRSAGNEATPHRTDGETLELRYIVFQGKQDMEKPDSLQNPAQELRRHVSEFQKRDGARRLGPLLDPSRNRSHSFGVFCTGLLQLLEK